MTTLYGTSIKAPNSEKASTTVCVHKEQLVLAPDAAVAANDVWITRVQIQANTIINNVTILKNSIAGGTLTANFGLFSVATSGNDPQSYIADYFGTIDFNSAVEDVVGQGKMRSMYLDMENLAPTPVPNIARSSYILLGFTFLGTLTLASGLDVTLIVERGVDTIGQVKKNDCCQS